VLSQRFVVVLSSHLPHGVLKVHKLSKRSAFIAQRISIASGENAMILARKRPFVIAGNVTLDAVSANVAHLTQIAWSPDRQNGARLVPVQATGSCGVLNLSLGATSVNLAGVQVSLDPIGLSISGQSGTPVGGLVCSLLSLVSSVGGIVGSVANVVNLLNNLLGSLTGALGGATGGLIGGL